MTKRIYVIQDVHTGLYFRCVDDHNHHAPDAPDLGADMYTQEDALAVAREYYTQPELKLENDLCHIRMGSMPQYFRWRASHAGKVMTPAKRLANSKRAKHKKRKANNETQIAA